MLIDTHSHIYSEEFDSDIDEVIVRAKKVGIEKIVLPDIDLEARKRMLALVDKHSDYLYPLIGLHPTSVGNSYKKELQLIEESLKKRKFWGIGETGIDLYWDKTYKSQQIESFSFQIELSLKHNLPIIIHARESFNEIFDVLDSYRSKGVRGILHCFSGGYEDAKKAIDYGLLLGIGGIISFKNSKLREVISQFSPKSIVLETDSPYLAPVPKRGKRNESSYIVHTAQILANVFDMELKEIGKITSQNAIKLFDF